MRWQDKLNSADHKHLKETLEGRVTLERVTNNVLAQETAKFPCWDCVCIGRKLGIPFELVAFNEVV